MPKIRPFSNGSQAEDWFSSNCDRCAKSKANNGNCDIELALNTAYFGDGEVSQEIGDRMAYNPDKYCWMCGEVEWCDWWVKECLKRQVRSI